MKWDNLFTLAPEQLCGFSLKFTNAFNTSINGNVCGSSLIGKRMQPPLCINAPELALCVWPPQSAVN